MKFYMFKYAFLSCVVFSLLTSCSPTKQLNNAVIQRNKDVAKNTKVIMPTIRSTPDNINMVYDFESLYTPEQQKKLDTLLRNFEKSNLIPIKLMTVNRQYMYGKSFEEIFKQQAAEWEQVHGNSGKTMLLLISVEQQDANLAKGPFASKFISDEDVRKIITDNRPAFEQGNVFEGTWGGLNDIMNVVRKNIVFDPKPIPPKNQ